MERLSRFVFGGEELIMSISSRAWTPTDSTVGGVKIAASGIPASYVVRRDAVLQHTLRFWEAEWPSVYNLIVFGQTAQSFTWYPEADELDSFEVYLDSPAVGESFSPSRDGEFPRVFEITLALRGVGTEVPWTDYFRMA